MNMKKILASLLAVVMLFAMIPVVASAATVNAPVDAAEVYTIAGKYYITTGFVAPMEEPGADVTQACQYVYYNHNNKIQYVNVGEDGYTLLNAKDGKVKAYVMAFDCDNNRVAVQSESLIEVFYNAEAEEYQAIVDYTESDIFMSNDCYYISLATPVTLTEGPTHTLAAPKVSNENEFYLSADVFMGVWAWGTQLAHWQGTEVKTWDAFVLGNTAANGGYNSLGWYGWILPNNDKGVNHGPMVALGYQFNDNDIVWVDGDSMAPAAFDLGAYGTPVPTVLAEDPATAEIVRQPDLRRATLWIDLTPINGNIDTLNTLYLYAKDGEGNIYCLNNAMKNNAEDPFLIEFGVARYDYTDGTNKYMVGDDGYSLYTPQSMNDTGMILGEKLDGTKVAARMDTIVEVPAPFDEPETEPETEAPTEPETEPETETKPAAPAATGKVTGASVVLGQALSITYNAIVENTTSVPTMRFTLGGKFKGEVEGEYNPTNGRYYFDLTGINPQQIGDNILAEVYVDGVLVATKDNYSVKTYLVGQLSKATTTTALKTLIYNTLAYGAAAQTFTGYNTDNMINAGYESNAVSYDLGDTAGAAQGFSLTNTQTANKISGVSVNFGDVNKIMVQYIGTDVTLYVNGEAVEAALANGKYTYYTDGIYASQLGKVFTFELKTADGTVISTLNFSVNAYAARNQGKVNNSNPTTAANARLAVALFNYGMAAKAYIG